MVLRWTSHRCLSPKVSLCHGGAMGSGTCSTAEPITYECLVIMPRMYHLSSMRQTRCVLFSVRQCGMQQRLCLLALVAPAYYIATLSLTTRRDSFHSFDATNAQPVYPQPNVGDCYAAISASDTILSVRSLSTALFSPCPSARCRWAVWSLS